MTLKRFLFALCLLLFVSAAAREARADTVAINSGFYRVSSPFFTLPSYVSMSADLQASTFRARASEGGGTNRNVSTTCAYPCLAGNTFSVGSNATLITASPASTSLDANGQQYNGWFTGTMLTFSTNSVTIPADQPADSSLRFTLTTTFTMTGTISYSAYDLNTLVLTPNVFSADVFGSGVAYIDMFYSSVSRNFEISGVRYEFQPAGVPEPATLVLLGTGLAGVAARYRRRRVRS